MNSSWLIHAPEGYGKWQSLNQAAAALLCESPREGGGDAPRPRLPGALGRRQACGACASCALLRAGTHPDLFVAVPQAQSAELGLTPPDDAGGAERADAKSASLDIRIDQIRRLADWAVATTHRGVAKVALIYPADALNPAAANALLKTLEEPPPGVHFLLGAHRLDALLPTIRSRCQQAPLPRPDAASARARVGASGAPEAMLAWCQGAVYRAEPAAGLDWAQAVIEAAARSTAPASTALPPPPDFATGTAALVKIASDLQRLQHRAPALYLPQRQPELERLARRVPAIRLADFGRRLLSRRRLAGFPLNQALAADALLLEFTQLFAPGNRDETTS